jgi:hypothetical protein
VEEEKIQKLTLELRRSVFEQIILFWDANKGLSHAEQFLINSFVSSSIIAQLTHIMFRKDIGTMEPFKYIDEVCRFTKEQYEEGAMKIKEIKNAH